MPSAKKVESGLLSAAKRAKRQTLWTGPAGEGPNGGVTFGLLSRWLTCRERCRLQAIEGLRAPEQFVASIEFGNMWHVCEEAAAGERKWFDGELSGVDTMSWEDDLRKYTGDLMRKFPAQQLEVAAWFEKCLALFPLYVGYWQDHPDNEDRRQIAAEGTFDVWRTLPSGRQVRLRGKRDSVDEVRSGKNAGGWVQENKTKSGIDQVRIQRQLTFDLQTMIYFTSLIQEVAEDPKRFGNVRLRGVRYNVVQRSSHKIVANMVKKVNEDVAEGRGSEWFARWNVEVTPTDVARFCKTCLDPLLENVLDDWEWWSFCAGDDRRSVWDAKVRQAKFCDHAPRHFVHPFGVRNILDEGGATDLDECIRSGSEVGLRRADVLFPELA